jgi:hypothetical protein
VKVARDAQYAIKCVSKEEVTVAPTPPTKPTPVVNNNAGYGGRTGGDKCSYCGELGMGMDNHHRNKCFIDPKSSMFKPEVRQRRLQMAVNKGIKIPKSIMDDGHFTQNNTATQSNHLTDAEVGDLVAALQLTGSVSPEEADDVVERMLGMATDPSL